MKTDKKLLETLEAMESQVLELNELFRELNAEEPESFHESLLKIALENLDDMEGAIEILRHGVRFFAVNKKQRGV